MRVGPLKLKVQLYCDDEIAIGPGKVDLLDAIDRNGSISAAGRALGMSYRRTWLLVDAMNRCWVEKLVDTTIGGGQQRGARLTPLGRRVLDAYRAMELRIASAARDDLAALAPLLRDHPLTPDADH
ncbi:MAG: ModE family transcriptional regulator [Sphingomonas bacterium]|nr:ModE family transcriptional regulator [Sphingomonas bacterium]